MGFRIIHLRKVLVTFVLFALVSFVLLLIKNNNSPAEWEREYKLKKIDEFIRNHSSSQACKQPNLPVYAPEMMKFVREEKRVDCSSAGIDWVVCEGSECRIQEQMKYRYDSVKCSFSDIIRTDDFNTEYAKPVPTNDKYKLKKSDAVRVSCKSAENDEWSSILTGIRMDNKVWENVGWERLPQDSFKLNVLMFGFDSVSRNTFIRKLPKSYAYLTNVLKGFVLQDYNIVGDGTPQALIPILTGKTELELPETRKRIKNAQFVNSYPFIWNEYKRNGYVTAYMEDMAEIGTFHYRLKGFDGPPTDHYMRPYYLNVYTEKSHWPRLCAGAIPRHKVMMNYIKDFFSVYKTKPKFLFGFHGELSHDSYNLVGVADDDLLELLKDLHESGALRDTVLILMADHGHRFAEIRNTVQGKLEERLPFFSFVLPPNFEKKHKTEFANFKANTKTLTTPFDIYSTLMHILSPGMVKKDERSLSLFSKIPKDRSCAHAYIEPHWCACIEWENITISSQIVQQLTAAFVETLNNYTEPHRDICEKWKLSKTEWALKMTPNENLLKFHKNADLDGFVPDLSARMTVSSNIYQIKVILAPGNAIFEASITHYLGRNKMEVKMSDISRVNMYGSQAKCVESSYPNLRKYCYCKG